MLTIEKVIKLLDEDHMGIFSRHLKESGAEYPLKLVMSIDRHILTEQSSGELCKAVYGEDNEKNRRKFFQLAHHTFRLTEFLSRNYPYYLLSSIKKVQELYNTGRPNEAKAYLQIGRELAEKIEDFDTHVIMLNILSQQAHINESFHEAHRYQREIRDLLGIKHQLTEICSILNDKFHPKQKPIVEDDLEQLSNFFKPFIDSKSFAVSIMGRYGYCYAIYFQNRKEFYSEDTYQNLLETEDQLKKYSYVKLPYLEDISYKIGYLKIRYMFHEMEEMLVIKEAAQFMERSEKVLFWNSFIKIPELFAIALQTSFYVTRYLTSYRDDHMESLPKDVNNHLLGLRKRCEELIDHPGWTDQFILKLINLKTIYSLLLLLGDKSDIKQSVQNLETVLVEYQQIPFHFYTDGIFTNIVVGYFCLGKYDDVVNSYKRYKKISDGKAVNTENDLTIHGFYYASQWMHTQRKQYLTKFNGIISKTNKPNLHTTRNLLVKLADYVKIPLEDIPLD